MEPLSQLLNNTAFWAFLGVFATAFFGYKGIAAPIIEERRRQKYAVNGKGRINVRKVTSFDELKAVVEILQNELERKDRSHSHELKRYFNRIEKLEDENNKMYEEIEHLKTRLRKAHINNE